MAEDKEAAGIEQECETWDWARAAGVSGEELRKALQASPQAAPDASARSPAPRRAALDPALGS